MSFVKRLMSKNHSNDDDKFDVTEKMRSIEEAEEGFKTKAGRKRHSIQLDRRISLQVASLVGDGRRSSNASTGTMDSLCE